MTGFCWKWIHYNRYLSNGGQLRYCLPNVESCLQIQTNHLVIFTRWTNSDELVDPKRFKKLLNLTEIIRKLITVDFSKLKMPKYL